MLTLKEVMIEDVVTVEPSTSILEAARIMKELSLGAIPVCDGRRLRGIITDRDIVVRGVVEQVNFRSSCVNDIMTIGIYYAFEDQDADKALEMMKTHQIRRLPVINEQKRLVGMVTLKDLSSMLEENSILISDSMLEISKTA